MINARVDQDKNIRNVADEIVNDVITEISNISEAQKQTDRLIDKLYDNAPDVIDQIYKKIDFAIENGNVYQLEDAMSMVSELVQYYSIAEEALEHECIQGDTEKLNYVHGKISNVIAYILERIADG
jgi:phage-related protein